MTHHKNLDAPWSLQFERDGTEDFGIICDAEGNDLVASHLAGSNTPRFAADPYAGCFWLPEYSRDPVPRLVSQMQLMTVAPELLRTLKTAERFFKGFDYGNEQENVDAVL